MIGIVVESPLGKEVRALIAASDAAMRPAFPPEEGFTLASEEPDRSEIRFFVARHAGRPSGCVAMVIFPDHAEVKRFLVWSEARGSGMGRRLMRHLEAAVRDLGIGLIRIETGHALRPAVRLYAALGYVPCARFGGYPDIPGNLFVEKRLD